LFEFVLQATVPFCSKPNHSEPLVAAAAVMLTYVRNMYLICTMDSGVCGGQGAGGGGGGLLPSHRSAPSAALRRQLQQQQQAAAAAAAASSREVKKFIKACV
jgi:hypothetical protein